MKKIRIPTKLPPHLKDLYKAAAAARQHAHVPYSGYFVGAAIRTRSGEIFGGCNVENASYGGTVCAERVAIFRAVAEGQSPLEVCELLVLTDASPAWPPCGFCRQVLAEFTATDAPIHAVNLKGDCITYTFGQLLPEAFSPSHLNKKKKRKNNSTHHKQDS